MFIGHSLTSSHTSQALVDDDLVHSDKIGISNFFWAFPSEAAVKLQNDISKHEAQLQDNQQQLASLTAKVEKDRAEKNFSVCHLQSLASRSWDWFASTYNAGLLALISC